MSSLQTFLIHCSLNGRVERSWKEEEVDKGWKWTGDGSKDKKYIPVCRERSVHKIGIVVVVVWWERGEG